MTPSQCVFIIYFHFNWEEEVAKLSEAQRLALFHSPLGVEAEKEDEEDSVVSQVYDADD